MPPTLLQPGLYVWPNPPPGTDIRTPVEIICDIISQKLTKRGRENKVFLLKAFTGAGKSTVFPQYMLTNIGSRLQRGICMAEPRVDLCTNGANDILSYNHQWSYGEEMGKLTGVSKIVARKKAHICFMTTQILQNHITSILMAYNNNRVGEMSRLLDRYAVVVMDEAHTHDIQTLSTVAAVKQLLICCGNEKNCPLFVFTSATLDNTQFRDYFETWDVEDNMAVGMVAPVANHPIQCHFLTDSEVNRMNTETKNKAIKYSDIYSQAARYVIDRYSKELLEGKMIAPNGARCRDLLIFAPTMRAITSMILSLFYSIRTNIPKFLVKETATIAEFERWRNDNRGKDRLVIMGYSASYSHLAMKLLEKPFSDDKEVLEYEMKWIVSTVAIESGKTVGTLNMCIDTGFDNKPVNNPLVWEPGKTKVVQIPACQNQITQRRGRVGRLTPGTFLTLYTEDCLNARPIDDMPDTVNNGCLSQTLTSLYIEPTRFPRIFDLTELNDNLYPIPPDLLIMSGRDLIFGNILGVNGDWMVKNVDKPWLRYARVAYYVYKIPLFEALLLSAINQYNLPARFEITTIHGLIPGKSIKMKGDPGQSGQPGNQPDKPGDNGRRPDGQPGKDGRHPDDRRPDDRQPGNGKSGDDNRRPDDRQPGQPGGQPGKDGRRPDDRQPGGQPGKHGKGGRHGKPGKNRRFVDELSDSESSDRQLCRPDDELELVGGAKGKKGKLGEGFGKRYEDERRRIVAFLEDFKLSPLSVFVEKNNMKAVEFILEARKEYNEIINGRSLSIIPYRGDWFSSSK